jgi:predicted O-methyltransferase YrrM
MFNWRVSSTKVARGSEEWQPSLPSNTRKESEKMNPFYETPRDLHKAISKAIQPMEGWCSLDKSSAMAALIVAVKPKVVVEIGVFGGRSLVPQAMALKYVGGGVIYGIDPWRREANLEGTNDAENDEWWSKLDIDKIHLGAVEAVYANHVEDHAVIIRAASQRCCGLWSEDGPNQIDILHLDGNHSEEASTRDVKNYLPKIRPGGYIWFDDVNWQTTTAALKMVEEECDPIIDVKGEGQHCRLLQKRPA